MILETILIILTLIVLFVSSYFDIKTREVPDSLTIGLIVLALIARLIYSIFVSEYSYIIYGLIGLAATFFVGLILYRTKQWGGADAKILMGLGVVFADFTLFDIPLLVILFINIILVGGLYGLVSAFVIYLKNKKAKVILKQHLKNNKKTRNMVVYIVAALLVISFLSKEAYARLLFLLSALFLLSYFYLKIFIKTIEQVGFIKIIPLKSLTEGDWLAEDIIYKNKILVSKKNPCILKKDITLLRKFRIREVTIKIGIPFLPAMTIATIITLVMVF